MTTMVETFVRKQTRMERYRDRKANGAKILPVHIACINFGKEANLAHCYRTAAVFGAEIIHLIGNCEYDRPKMRAISGTTSDLTELVVHKSPSDFVQWCRENEVDIVSLELPEDVNIPATKLHEYNFSFDRRTCIVGGHETAGVSLEILKSGDVVYIESLGAGHCLNVSQAVNTAMYEYTRQYINNIGD